MTKDDAAPERAPGRPTLSPTGERMKDRKIKMLDEQWRKFQALGGAAAFRAQLDATPWPQEERQQHPE